MIINMIQSILCLLLFAAPLLAQPEGCNSLTKRYDTLLLKLYMKEHEFSNDTDTKVINFTTAYPVGAKPVTLQPTYDPYGQMIGDGLDMSTWTNTMYAHLLASIPLRADEGTRTFHTEGLGKGKDLNVSHGLLSQVDCDSDTW